MAPPKTADLAERLEEIQKTLSSYDKRFDKLENLLAESQKENKELRKTLQDRDAEVLRLNQKLNDLEQYGRSWSIRVLNLPIPSKDSTDPLSVMEHVHAKVLTPIFKGAVEKGLLTSIPPALEVLETAHILPSKPNSTPAIICRFYSRNMRALVFRLKKECAPRLPGTSGNGAGAKGNGPFRFPIFEDLTRANFFKMRAISKHDSVLSCWSVSGSLRFRLKDSDQVKKVSNIYDSVENIVNSR